MARTFTRVYKDPENQAFYEISCLAAEGLELKSKWERGELDGIELITQMDDIFNEIDSRAFEPEDAEETDEYKARMAYIPGSNP